MENLQSLIESFTESTPAVKMANGSDYPEYKVVNRTLPYFTPEEKENLDGYYSDIETEEEDKLYNGLVFESTIDQTTNAKSWMERINLLQIRLSQTEDPDEIDEIKQRLVAMGWNPEVKYNIENSIKAANRFINLVLLKHRMVIEDVSNWKITDADIINESKLPDLFRPIYLVFIKGESKFSDLITAVTNGEFSHAAISLDESMEHLYSYNVADGTVGPFGGFSRETIKNYPQNNRFAVYSVVLDKPSYKIIKEKIDYVINNADKTKYAFKNIFTFPMKVIGSTNKFEPEMICSQFVDSLLKLANVDLAPDIPASKISPQKLYEVIKNSDHGFKVFDGFTKDYNSTKARSIMSKVVMKKILNKNEACIIEARSIPVEINHDGDVLLSNPFPNFDEEYYASHKLLMQYEKSGNLEGMKYELCRLFYMNYILESKLYHNKILSNKEKNIKTRARILNDFNKYLKYVLSKDKNFNFAQYYEKSPFYAHTYKITKPTVLAVGDLVKYVASIIA